MEIKPPQHLWHSTRKRQQLRSGGGGSMSALTISKTLRTIRRSITTTIYLYHHRGFTVNMPCLPRPSPPLPMFCSFSWVLQSCQEKLRTMLNGEAGGSGGEGVNEVHYGQNGKLKTFDVPASTRLQIKKNNIVYCLGQCENGEFKFQNIILGPTHLSSPRVMGQLSK